MDLMPISFEHLFKGRDQRELVSQRLLIRLLDHQRILEYSREIVVVKDHWLEVAGPADVEFYAPYPGLDSRVKSLEGIFQNCQIVVLSTVGNDFTSCKML